MQPNPLMDPDPVHGQLLRYTVLQRLHYKIHTYAPVCLRSSDKTSAISPNIEQMAVKAVNDHTGE